MTLKTVVSMPLSAEAWKHTKWERGLLVDVPMGSPVFAPEGGAVRVDRAPPGNVAIDAGEGRRLWGVTHFTPDAGLRDGQVVAAGNRLGVASENILGLHLVMNGADADPVAALIASKASFPGGTATVKREVEDGLAANIIPEAPIPDLAAPAGYTAGQVALIAGGAALGALAIAGLIYAIAKR